MLLLMQMNTVEEPSQSSPASKAVGVILMIIITFAVFKLFGKDKW